MTSDSTPPAQRGRPSLKTGCAAALLVAVLVTLGGLYAWLERGQRQERALLDAQAQRAEQAFGPVLEKLAPPPAPTYDIDRTIRVIHGIDLALAEEDDLEGYLSVMARQDYRNVAPDVLEARRELLDVLQPLYARQVQAEDQEAMWELTSELLLSTLSVVSVSAEVDLAASGELSVDREQAQTLLKDLKDRRAERKELVAEITKLERELFDALVDYADVYYRYVEEWDSLSVLRDRAYLAAHNGDWGAARASAELAVQRAPHDREAHLLLAQALIEGNNPEDDGEIERILSTYVQDHPDSTAPAMVLLGVHHTRRGRTDEAVLAFQQSAAYYPRQADQLLDMLDPYRMRGFLRKSREGGFILEQYRSTMLGAGYYSPDLQRAQLEFERGSFEVGRAKVLDHFARRRAQEQWDFLIADVEFCHELLGPHFWEIFPEDTYLDLLVSKPLLGGGLALSVHNRSPRVLHNATLVLTLHLTDMYPGQYSALRAPQTAPSVLAHETTDFGTVEVAIEHGGRTRGVADIVEHRAIMVSDEAVMWVDTDAFKIAEAEEFLEERRAARATQREVVHPTAARHPDFQPTVQSVLGEVSRRADVAVEQRYGSDHVLITLPRELSILRPVFRLRYGDTLFDASDNLIEGDRIQLRFKAVENFDEVGDPEDIELLLASPFGDVVFTWSDDGLLVWNFEGVNEDG